MKLPRCFLSLAAAALVALGSSSLVDSASAASDAATRAAPTFKKGVNISHWLSQNGGKYTFGAPWFNAEDVKWIATHGFDHIRIAVDVRLCLNPAGELDDAKLKPVWDALGWAKANHLNVVFDAHFLPGADFNSKGGDNRAFTDPALMDKVAGLWRELAQRFAKEGDYLRFEILNEPVADENQQVNTFMHRMLASIRESNPTRVVYVTSNRWSGFSTVPDVVLPDDPNIALTVHFYEPMIFTHQRAPWTNYKDNMPPIEFPGKVPDLTGTYEPGTPAGMLREGEELTEAEIGQRFAKVAEWVKENRPGLEVYVGEFGVYEPAPKESKKRWLRKVVSECESHGWGWAVWEYEGAFGVHAPDGSGTDVLEGLFPSRGGK